MKLKNLLFKKSETEKKIKKDLHVYISEKHSEIIFAPMYREINIPIYFEQETCEVINFHSTTETIGQSIKRNFNKFHLRERNNTHNKKTDWSALKASKEKTIKGFKKTILSLI